MMRQVIHLSTFQPPVHNAILDALWPVKDFYRPDNKTCVVFYSFGSLDRVAGLLVTLKSF